MYVLGIDLGTSSLKGILVNKKGEEVASSHHNYSLTRPSFGFSEQDPRDWIIAFNYVIQELLRKVEDFQQGLEGVSFSGQMHSLVLLDKDKKLLRPAILWNDGRTTEQCERINSNFGKQLLNITKNKALEGFTLPKILWVKENEAEVWDKVNYVLLPKDYLSLYLTDSFYTDYSDAAGTLLFDIEKKQWSEEILNKFDLNKNIFPELKGSGEYLGKLKDEIKDKYAFKNDIKVFMGGADNACSALSAGIIKEDTALCSIGTSGVFLSFENTADVDYNGKLHVFNHAYPDLYYSMGVTLSAGKSLSWYRDTFYKNETISDLLRDIQEVPPGSEGLLFTPYIMGERTPYIDSKIRGSFIGIDIHHQKKHFSRSILEGITFSLKDSKIIMEAMVNKSLKKIVSVGGGAKNENWLQMQADIFEAEIVTLNTEQGPGFGACILAAVGCGWFPNLSKCIEAFVYYGESYKPMSQNVAAYKNIYNHYKKIYPATKSIMEGNV